MIQRRRGVGFLIETAETIAILREFFREDFERDFAAQLCVFGEINFAHAACAKLFEDAITRNGCQVHRGTYFDCASCSSVAASAPSIRTIFCLEVLPAIISTAFCGNLKV